MFRPHYGYCQFCKQNDKLIVVKAGYCQQCNYIKNQANKKSKPKVKKYVPTGEKDVFHQVLDNLPDVETKCFVCGTPIALVTHHNFAHILNKKNFPLFRLNPDNIKIMCFKFVADNGDQGCHYNYDFKPRSELKGEGWEKVFKLEEELKKLYKEQK